MSRHHLYVLIVVALVALGAGLWVSEIREIGPGQEDNVLVPGLSDSLNDVSALTIVGPGDTALVTIVRGDTRWTVAEKGGYAADTAKLRESLRALAESKVLEEKTGRAENYPRLGVEDVSADDAAGVRVDLTGDMEPVSIIVGNRGAGSSGHFVRRAGDSTSLLASGSLSFDSDPADWLASEILDIDSKRIQRIEIVHADGSTLVVSKDDAAQADFSVHDVPAGRSLISDRVANSMALAWQGLMLEDVEPSETTDDTAATTTTVTTFDGLVVVAGSYTADDERYFEFSASVADPEEPEPADSEEAPESGEEQAGDGADEPVDVQREARDINSRTSGWRYKVPGYKSEQIAQSMDELLKPIEE